MNLTKAIHVQVSTHSGGDGGRRERYRNDAHKFFGTPKSHPFFKVNLLYGTNLVIKKSVDCKRRRRSYASEELPPSPESGEWVDLVFPTECHWTAVGEE